MSDIGLLFAALPGSFVAVCADAPEFTVTAVSDAYLQKAGKRREQLAGRGLFSAIGEDAALRASFEKVLASGKSCGMCSAALGADGTVRFIIHRAEESLQQQWETFDTALSHTPDFAYIFDLEGRFRYGNEPFLKRVGKSYDEVMGKNLTEMGYPDELAAKINGQIQRVIATKEQIADQTAVPRPDGSTVIYEYVLMPVTGEGGAVAAVAGWSRDITEQKRAEELVEKDRQRWRALLLQAPAAIAVFEGPQHRFGWVNGDMVRLAGRSSEKDLLGRTIDEALPEIAAQGYVDMLNQVFATGEPYAAHEAHAALEHEGRRSDVYVNFVCMPTRDAQGRVDGTFVHATDVTDLVKARKEREESERQFRTLAETIPHLAWMAHSDGHIFWYNQRWYDYTGTTLEEMEGWGWQKVHDPEALPKVMELWKHSIDSGEPLDTTIPLKAKDGTFRMFLTRVEPVKDENGRVVRWFGTNTDVTEQKRTEEELRRVNRNLEEFSYVASHDLQEPLRMVNIYTQLILKAMGETEGNLAKYGGFVRQGVGRMEMLIQDLLTFSRAVHSEQAPVSAQADLHGALSEALATMKARIEESGATIRLPEALPAVRGDTDQLAHVFQNLLSNSVKYRRKDAPLAISIGSELSGAYCTISVRDNGIGFEPKYAETIFGLFKRLHKREDYPGTGLGLAICQRIVERCGGRMWAEGKPNEGAVFYFSLPLAGDPAKNQHTIRNIS